MISRFVPFAVLLVLGTALAQLPNLPAEYLEQSRQLQGDRIRLCVLQDMPLTELNEETALLLGHALLLDVVVYEVSVPHLVQPLGYRSPLSDEQLFFLLNNECDAFMGYLYGVGTYPEWLVTTVPYLRTGFVLVSMDSTLSRLSDVPYGSRVGTQLGSAPNSRFLSLVRSLPEGQTWRRIPYPDNEILLERVSDGSLDAALVWEPAVAAYEDPRLQVAHDLTPLPAVSADFVITMVSGNSYLQSLLDSAISAVSADGSLQQLIDAAGVPAQALP